jgi:DNA primase
MAYVDFATVKEQVPVEQAIERLGLSLKQRNGQWRGPCPTCQSGGERALVVTPAKRAFYCFGARVGGDVIAFVAHIRDCSMKDAAEFLSEGNSTSTSAVSRNSTSSGTVPEERSKEGVRNLRPLTYLQPGHETVLGMGLEEDTCVSFGAGYAPKGIMRGRLAIPIHDWNGNLVAYCGRTVTRDSPTLIFPNGFRPEEHIFNANRIGEGELVLMRDPIDVLLATQNGIDNAVCFLTETVTPHQLQILAAFMDSSGIEAIELH